MLRWMHEHALAVVTDRYGRFIPREASINVAMRAIDIGIVCKGGANVRPIPPFGDAFVTFDYILSVQRCDVIGHPVRFAPTTHLAEKRICLVWRAIPYICCLVAVVDFRQIANCVRHRHVLCRSSRSMRWIWKWTPVAEIVFAVPEIAMNT